MNDDQARELIELQRETNRWLRIVGQPVLLATLEESLASPGERSIYQASDGRSSRDVGAAAGVGRSTVQRNWKKWATIGLVEEVADGTFVRAFDLDALGIPIK